jgi:trimeric autotransporter adhesin
VIGGRNNLIGSATAGNSITGNGQNGVYITGIVTGTRVQGNEISGNAKNGVMLVKARRLTIGGSAPGSGNQIVENQGFGLYAEGACSGTAVQGNVIAANTKGNINLTRSSGIVYIPKV